MQQCMKNVWLVCAVGALGGLLFGLDQGFIANSLATIQDVYHLDLRQEQAYSAALAWGAIVGVVISGFMVRELGRKTIIVLSGILFFILSCISATLPPLKMLVFAREGIGFAVGMASFAVPLYLVETAPTKLRGSMTALFQLMVTIGICLIAVSNLSINKLFGHAHISLMLMFSVISVFSFVMLIGAFYLPESPRWFILKNREQNARDVLRQMNFSEKEIEAEINEINQNLSVKTRSCLDFLKKSYYWKALVIGLTLQVLQQAVGINVIIYYMPKIFGYIHMVGIAAALVVPVLNMLFTFPAIYWIEKWGRKKLLMMGSFIMLVSTLVIGFTFSVLMPHSDPNNFVKSVLLIFVGAYIFGFACSWGAVVWVLCSEIFPIKVREIGMTMTTVMNWLCTGFVMSTALSFIKIYGNASIFFLMSGFCVLSMIFIKFFIPETKGVSLEKIEQNLMNGVKINKIGV
jgi:MFS transporter, SP family, galactose:H+ symporter